jgi:2-methylisocitrate lyase-like PEP mutase family enzyme
VIADSPEQWAELKEVLAGHCAAIERDVNEITCSVNVRIGSDANIEPAVAAAAAYREAGADLVIVYLPHHPKPDSLKPLAEALSPLA